MEREIERKKAKRTIMGNKHHHIISTIE